MAEQALVKSEALTDATEDLNTQSGPARDEVDYAREEREEEKLEVERYELRYERLAKLAGLNYADAMSRVKEIDKKSCYYTNPDRPDYTELCNSGKKVETLKGMLRALISGSRFAEKEHWQVCLAMVGNRWDRRRIDSLAEQYKELMAGFDKINEEIANTGKLVVTLKTAGEKLGMLNKELIALKKIDEEVKRAAKLKREVFWACGFRDILQIMEEASSALVKVGMAKLLEGKN
ncbi:hypothetical protein BKA80DRAFT_346150 [Phyllosticta citrichinensis]